MRDHLKFLLLIKQTGIDHSQHVLCTTIFCKYLYFLLYCFVDYWCTCTGEILKLTC